VQLLELLLLVPVFQVDKELLKELLVHSLPQGATSGQVFNALAAACPSAPLPKRLDESRLGEGRLGLIFKDPADVEALFQALPGAVSADSHGRRTKGLQLPGGAQVRFVFGWSMSECLLWFGLNFLC
jgi:hypothetical protein